MPYVRGTIIFGDGVKDQEKLAHAGTKGNLWRFAGSTQTFIEGTDHRVEADSRDRRHVKSLAHISATSGNEPFTGGGATVTGKGRQEEIARMLGGKSDSALKLAATLLKERG